MHSIFFTLFCTRPSGKGRLRMPLLLLLLMLLSICQPVCAAPDLFSFAESLAAEEDHYRAITEYKRFLHYFPQDPRAPRAQLGIAESLLAGQRWEQAEAALEKTWQKHPTSPEATEARRFYAQSAFDQKKYPEARQRYQRLKGISENLAEQINYQVGLSYLEEGAVDKAQESFAALNRTQADKLLTTLEEYRQLPRKSPSLAGTLSAILPGAGQLYTERPRQSAVAFALNAVFIYGAIEAWNNENYTVAGILSLFEIGWYGGNIYNAMNNAHKYNRAREETFKQRFKLNFGMLGQAPWLQAQFRF